MIMFISELNGLQLWGADVGNAYLEAKTKEKVCFIAGKEFGPLAGHTLIIHKALYGLRTSGLRWHEKFADILTDMGFKPCKMDPDIWLWHMGDHYEYIGTYIDDFAIASHHLESLLHILTNNYKFKLKGIGPFHCDEDGTLCQS